jgi:hypothetical protein
MARSIFDQDSIANKYSLLGQGSPNQQLIQEQKIQQGLLPRTQPTTQTNQTTKNMTPVATSRNVKMGANSPSKGNNLLQGVTNFVGTDFGTGFTQGLLGASKYSPVPVTFGQALSEAMQAGNQLVTDRSLKSSFRPMTADEKAMFGITEGNWAINTVTNEPVSLDKGKGVSVEINQAGDDELQKLDAKNFNAIGTELGGKATKAQEELNKFAKVEALMRNIPEGDFGAFSRQKLEIKKLLKFDVANLEALNVEFGAFVMGQIQNTKGAVSEREMDYFGEISPTITKTRDGLELMIDIMTISNKQVIEKNDFYNKWSRDWRANNKDKSVSDLKNDWEIAEKEWDEKNNSILTDQLTKRINQQIINNYEGNFDKSSFDSAKTQNAIRAFEKEQGFNLGEAVLLDVIGDNTVELGFYKTTEDGYTFIDQRLEMDF